MVLPAMIVFDWHSWQLPSFWLYLKKYFILEGWPWGIYSVERWKYFFNCCFMTRENKEKGLWYSTFQQQECTVLDQWTLRLMGDILLLGPAWYWPRVHFEIANSKAAEMNTIMFHVWSAVPGFTVWSELLWPHSTETTWCWLLIHSSCLLQLNSMLKYASGNISGQKWVE